MLRKNFRVWESLGIGKMIYQDQKEFQAQWLGGILTDKTGTKIVQQWTGRVDKNGKKIFEGDIVKKIVGSTGRQKEIIREVVYQEDECKFSPEFIWRDKDVEIVGNIYETPNLLKI